MDDLVNFGFSLVALAPSPADSGLSLSVTPGEAVNFPAPPFNVTVSPSGVRSTKANSEILRVTDIVGDVLTIARQQEGSTARSIIVGDRIAATITKKMIEDLRAEIAAPHVDVIYLKNLDTGEYDPINIVGQGNERQFQIG